MAGFNVSTCLRELDTPFPQATSVLIACRGGGLRARNAFSRQWLSEGTPYAFRENPGLYDAIREWVSLRLDVNPKEISLTGSARLGQSLAPKKIGSNFNEDSDLDLFVVSDSLFSRLKDDFLAWSDDFDTGRTKAENPRQEGFWKDTRKRLEGLIAKGFLDSYLLPSSEKYQSALSVNRAMSLLIIRLSETDHAPKVKKATMRCYRNWESFVRQSSLNLEKAEQSLP